MPEIKKKLFTLCIVCQDSRVLLGMKKEGFGAGRWNGFGGKVEEGETVEAAARREVSEEAGLTVADMEEMGVIEFTFSGDSKILEVHVFKATEFSGTPKETDEMRPEWFDVNKIPYVQMWPADVQWIPLLLQGKKFKAKFLFDQPSTAEYSAKILKQDIREVE